MDIPEIDLKIKSVSIDVVSRTHKRIARWDPAAIDADTNAFKFINNEDYISLLNLKAFKQMNQMELFT